LESFLKLLLADIKDSRVVYGALPGEIFYDADNKAVAAQLASAIFGEKQIDSGPACPVCGGKTFRFLNPGHHRLDDSSGIDWIPADFLPFENRRLLENTWNRCCMN
jgi:hypothetical protein